MRYYLVMNNGVFHHRAIAGDGYEPNFQFKEMDYVQVSLEEWISLEEWSTDE